MTCTSCGAENRQGARFCDSCGAALAVEAAREQRKVVTVLFCDVSGSTALGEKLDPEALRAVMARYFDVARAAVERHGGTLEKFIGDAVMAVFGVPTVREDDALRAVRAAEELRDGVEVDVRIGVNTGEVVTGTGDSLVTGDAVNVAARLEQAAGGGEIFLGAETYNLVRDAVDAELLPPLEAKGKSNPLTAYRLRAVTGDVAVARRLDAPLVGRTREKRLLEDAFERSRSERACVLFTILGSAGVGKSRLTAEFLDGVDATVVRGRCLSYGEGITYWPVVEVVLPLLAGEPAPNAALASLLGEGEAPTDEIALAVRKLIEAKASGGPLVVVFDDLQWGEPTFLDLVEHVADWSRDAPILLLCLARPDLLERREGWGGGKLNATTVLLEPLTAAETDELIDELLGGTALEPAVRERIRAAADGNPLFVEQMLAMLQQSPGEVTVPSTIQALLAARLDQLPPSERATLERGAIEGQVFHRSAVAALDADPSSLLPLVRKELVRPSAATLPGDDAFRFRHLLIRDAAYDALPKSTRAELHERFADWLAECVPDLVELDEIVGYHLEQAARFRTELGSSHRDLERRASERLAAAGLKAEAREDQPAAESLFRRAIELLPKGSAERLRLLPSHGYALYQLGRLDDAYAVFDEAAELGDPETAATALFHGLGARGHAESLSPVQLERLIREKLDEINGRVGPRALATGYDMLAWALYWQGRNGEAIEAGNLAVELATKSGARVVAVDAMRVVSGAMVYGETPWPEVERHADRMAASGVPSNITRAWAFAMRGQFDEARLLLDSQRQRFLEQGQLGWAHGMSNASASLELLAGKPDRAEAILREGWDGLGELGERGFRSTVGGLFGRVLALLDRSDEAVEVLDKSAAMSSPDDWMTAAEVAAGRALVASRSGDHERACALVGEAVELADAREYVTSQQDLRLLQGEILLAAGRQADARSAFLRARDAAAHKGSTVLVDRIDERLAASRVPEPRT